MSNAGRCRHNQEASAALQENQDCILIMYGLLGSLCLEVLLDVVEFQAALHIEDTVSLLSYRGSSGQVIHAQGPIRPPSGMSESSTSTNAPCV